MLSTIARPAMRREQVLVPAGDCAGQQSASTLLPGLAVELAAVFAP